MGTAQRSDAAKNRSAIVAAAVGLFASEGIEVPVEAIVRAAGVGRATFYRHFPERHDLTAAALSEAVDDLRTLHTSLLAAADPTAALATWLRALVAFSSTYRGLPTHVLDASSPSSFRETCDQLEAMTTELTEGVPNRESSSLGGTDLYILANAIAWTIDLTGDRSRANVYVEALARA